MRTAVQSKVIRGAIGILRQYAAGRRVDERALDWATQLALQVLRARGGA